jgi:hypothetical protein
MVVVTPERPENVRRAEDAANRAENAATRAQDSEMKSTRPLNG